MTTSFRTSRLAPTTIAAVSICACSGSSTSPSPQPPPPPPPPPQAATVNVSPGELSLNEGGSGTLTATVRSADGQTLSLPVSWTSQQTEVATVSASGRVTAVAPGTATIVAAVGTVQGNASITVTRIPVSSVTISAAPAEFETGADWTLIATTRSSTGTPLPSRAVTWASSDPGIATVTSTGVVVGTGSGDVTITATSEGVSATTTFRVDSRTAWLRSIIDSARAAGGLPAMGAIIVTRTGVFGSAEAGVRQRSLANQVGPNDLWHIGSNLKGITGFLAAEVVGAGSISWNTTLAEAYPELAGTMRPEYAAVTLRMLLAHAGGVIANVDNPVIPGNGSLPSQRFNIAAWATSLAPAAPVGTYLYSNVRYMIAANMIERATGQSWEDLMQIRLLGPLGISGFGWGPAPAGSGQNPAGHQRNGSTWSEAVIDNPPYLSAAGRSHWTLDGWGRIIREIMLADQGSSSLVQQSELRTANTPVHGNGYAAGWFAITADWTSQGRGLAHDGSNNWNYSTAQVALDRGVAVLTVTNAATPGSNDAADAVISLAGRLWQYYAAH